MQTFTWVPSYSSRISRTSAVTEIQFGDNYTQRISEGINTSKLVFTLVFPKSRSSDVLAIDAFINAHKGRIPFIWNPPTPYNYQDAENYVGAFSYNLGQFVKQGSNVFQCIQTHNEPQDISNELYWTFITRLPMIFTCKEVGGTADQYDATSLSLTFTQVFDPQ